MIYNMMAKTSEGFANMPICLKLQKLSKVYRLFLLIMRLHNILNRKYATVQHIIQLIVSREKALK